MSRKRINACVIHPFYVCDCREIAAKQVMKVLAELVDTSGELVLGGVWLNKARQLIYALGEDIHESATLLSKGGEVMQTIIAEIGVEGAALLQRAYSGTRFYVPRTLTKNHKLVRVLGRRRAEILCNLCAGEQLVMVVARNLKRMFRDKEIVKSHNSGVSVPALALRFDLSEAYIYRLLRKLCN